MSQKNIRKGAKNGSRILFFNRSTFQVAECIFNYPNRVFHIRELASITGLSTTAVIASVSVLDGYGIVKIEKTRVTKNVSADLESESYVFYKKVFNLYRLERYSLISRLKDRFNPDVIVLFGSFAKGEDIEDSDIDILVLSGITKQKAGIDAKFLEIPEKTLNRKINLHVMPDLKDSSKEFLNAAANGIVLHGYLKVV